MKRLLQHYSKKIRDVNSPPAGNGPGDLEGAQWQAEQLWAHNPNMLAALKRRAQMRREKKLWPFSEPAERHLLKVIIKAAPGLGSQEGQP